MAIPWHRLFGMALTQYFAGTSCQVDVEIDLSLQAQRLDLAILRRRGAGTPPRWPDGFGPPADYNLLTFKALKDALDAWALKELAGHGVNYRKQISPNPNALLPESDFRLLAATMQYPRKLASQVTLQPQGPGAYDVLWGTDTIRILVLREMPEAEQNLVWNLFSSDPERIARAFQRLKPRLESWSSLLNDLLCHYGLEGMAMPYTMEDYKRDAAQRLLSELTPEERLQGLRPEERLQGLRPEERLQGLRPEERLQGLSPEQLLSLMAEIEAYLKKHKTARDNDAPAHPETSP